MSDAPFHEGEAALQRRAGARERLALAGPRVLRDHLPEQHREFFGQLPFLLVGSVDAAGQPWASILAGASGFVGSPDPRHLVIQARPLSHDPLQHNLHAGAPIGLLGIEPHTRRRNRMNGTVRAFSDAGFEVEVAQSFGNCPKYIQARRSEYLGPAAAADPPAAQRSHRLDARARALVERADTFFVATAHPLAGQALSAACGVDVSHRGGRPGFVRVDNPAELTVPDFLGNYFFNTLGNLALNPRCGLLFVDFANGDLLYCAATAQVLWDGPELLAFRGAQRLLRLELVSVLRVEASLPLHWSQAELSPLLADTGSWASPLQPGCPQQV